MAPDHGIPTLNLVRAALDDFGNGVSDFCIDRISLRVSLGWAGYSGMICELAAR
jgi:hypothetical protein